MKNMGTKNSSLISALILATIGTLVAFVFNITTFQLFLTWIILFAAAFLVVYVSIQRFLFSKIKFIYRTIYTLKSKKLNQKVASDIRSSEPLAQVNKNVQEWAKDKSLEIEQLKLVSKYKQDFLGNVSHELKTPIFNIQGYIYTLLDGAMEDKNVARKFLVKARKSADRIESLVTDLLLISELETGREELKLQTFDLLLETKDIFETLDFKAPENGVKLHLGKIIGSQILVIADRSKIRQVLINLIVNSIKYGKKGGSTWVKFFDAGDHYLVEVRDNGSGIERKHLPRLFERFYRTDDARSRDKGDTGLGLAIVKHIIEAHNETINVRSELNVGTTFGFTLPKA